MSTGAVHHCSFCGAQQSADTALIAGIDGHICESCVSLAHQVVNSLSRRCILAEPLKKPPPPREIKERLDIDYLMEENRILKHQAQGHRLHLSDNDRRRLAARAKASVSVNLTASLWEFPRNQT